MKVETCEYEEDEAWVFRSRNANHTSRRLWLNIRRPTQWCTYSKWKDILCSSIVKKRFCAKLWSDYGRATVLKECVTLDKWVRESGDDWAPGQRCLGTALDHHLMNRFGRPICPSQWLHTMLLISSAKRMFFLRIFKFTFISISKLFDSIAGGSRVWKGVEEERE